MKMTQEAIDEIFKIDKELKETREKLTTESSNINAKEELTKTVKIIRDSKELEIKMVDLWTELRNGKEDNVQILKPLYTDFFNLADQEKTLVKLYREKKNEHFGISGPELTIADLIKINMAVTEFLFKKYNLIK